MESKFCFKDCSGVDAIIPEPYSFWIEYWWRWSNAFNYSDGLLDSVISMLVIPVWLQIQLMVIIIILLISGISDYCRVKYIQLGYMFDQMGLKR